jgi:hypothetical protein
VKKHIARGVGIVAALMAAVSMAMVGATAAHADSPLNKKYSDAVNIVKKSGGTPVLATVTGDVLSLDDCIVTSATKSSAKSAVGDNNGRKVLLNVNCNAKVAQAGVPGNSAMTPQGKSAKADIKVANQINKDPKACYKSDDNLAYCKRVCKRTGLCDADSL